MVWVERQRGVAGVLPCGEHRPGQRAASLLVGSACHGEVGRPHVRRARLRLLGPAASPPGRCRATSSTKARPHWNDLLRLVGSMKFGHTTASLLIAKLHASSRLNSLA
ncbi:MAG: hypothetical protein DLM56_03715 [Pseudonocardiales bacterium]|nr:MAG: hypothetical protein DLM56_03715 [Pseudonocardiales bacterium]